MHICHTQHYHGYDRLYSYCFRYLQVTVGVLFFCSCMAHFTEKQPQHSPNKNYFHQISWLSQQNVSRSIDSALSNYSQSQSTKFLIQQIFNFLPQNLFHCSNQNILLYRYALCSTIVYQRISQKHKIIINLSTLPKARQEK